MKHLRKCTALLLAVLMVFALAACGEKDTGSAVDKDLTVNVVSLNGTTGFGMAKLMADSKAGSAARNYNFTVETDPSNATAALDLTAEWDKVSEAGSLVQGCVVVRKAFADEHPNEVKAFLDEYKASIEFLTAEPEQAGQMIQDAGIFAKAAVAAKAIPNCNVCFVSGAEMQAPLTAFLTALSTVAPQSIGGSVPGDDFYCVLK